MRTNCLCYGAIAGVMPIASLADIIFDYGHGGGQLPRSLARLEDEDFYAGSSPMIMGERDALFYVWAQRGALYEREWMHDSDDPIIHLSYDDGVITIKQSMMPTFQIKKVRIADAYDHGDELMAGLSSKMVARPDECYQNELMDTLLWATRFVVAGDGNRDPFFLIADHVSTLRQVDPASLPLIYR